ncbi:MAG: hypothetical protein RL022_2938 [Chloroflexota bacterium]
MSRVHGASLRRSGRAGAGPLHIGPGRDADGHSEDPFTCQRRRSIVLAIARLERAEIHAIRQRSPQVVEERCLTPRRLRNHAVEGCAEFVDDGLGHGASLRGWAVAPTASIVYRKRDKDATPPTSPGPRTRLLGRQCLARARNKRFYSGLGPSGRARLRHRLTSSRRKTPP